LFMSAPSTVPCQIIAAEFTAAAAAQDQLPPPQCPEIAFAGRSNVGKSSLMNAIMGRRKLVRTSSTPGCTRTVSFFHVTTAAKTQLMLVDLPGYGYAQRSHGERANWAKLIEGYLLQRPSLRVLVLLVDARREFTDDERQLVELISDDTSAQRPTPSTVVVATKLDQVPASKRAARVRALSQQAQTKIVGLSALDTDRVADFWRELHNHWLGLAQQSVADECSNTP
jgi:GTP-binding protein